MPKPTVFTKKETGSQTGINNLSNVNSLSIQNTDLLENKLV